MVNETAFPLPFFFFSLLFSPFCLFLDKQIALFIPFKVLLLFRPLPGICPMSEGLHEDISISTADCVHFWFGMFYFLCFCCCCFGFYIHTHVLRNGTFLQHIKTFNSFHKHVREVKTLLFQMQGIFRYIRKLGH